MAETISGLDPTERSGFYKRALFGVVDLRGLPVLPSSRVLGTKERGSGYNGNCVELSFDPDRPGRLLMGDSKQPESTVRLSIDPVVAHEFFTGMQTAKDTKPGRFTYESLEASTAEGHIATTAKSFETMTDEDLVLCLDTEGMVSIGTHGDGPVFSYDEDEWNVFVSGVNNPESNLNGFVYWAEQEAAYQAEMAAA